jgi:hypothetical protein
MVGRKAFRRFGFVESAVVARWAEIVGPAYARVSSPESLRFPQGKRSGGTLRLSVSGAHALTLQHVEPQIIERVNRFFGYAAVSRISIQQGRPQPRAEAPKPQEKGEIPADVASSLKEIADPGLKASLEDLARQISVTTGLPKIG